ncbi:flagellar assembly protein FliX [Muricoccus nepalensis]|nr:flagellar assembly protein FliX [Roseomonas nepalensis]
MSGRMIGSVAGPGGAVAAGRTGAGARAGKAGAFRLPESAREVAGAGAAQEVAPLGLMALQEAEDATGRNRRGAARARDMLRDLSALQMGLLAGEADPEALQRLAVLAEGEAPPDPVLADALAGIGLRARIELARHTMRRSTRAGSGAPEAG